MKISLRASLLFALALGGCGGRVHEPAVVNPLAKFVGTWSGPYTLDGSVAGTVTLTIDRTISMSGTVASSLQGGGTLSGYIEDSLDDGPFAQFNFEFASPPPPDVSNDHRHQGFASVDARGHLIIVHGPQPTSAIYITPEDFDLAPVAATPMKRPALLSVVMLLGCGGRVREAPVVSPLASFVGAWSGPYTLDGSVAGTVSLKVAKPSDGTSMISGSVASVSFGAGTVEGDLVDEGAGDAPFARFDFDYSRPSDGTATDDYHPCSAALDGRGHLILTHLSAGTSGVVASTEDFDLVRVVATP